MNEDSLSTYNGTQEDQRIYDLIWSQMPEMQKRTSSSWWFFILFPKGEEGYGPRQMMFSLATRVGERVRINDVWLPGLDLKRTIDDGVDCFPTLSVGWYCDGQTVYEDIIKEVAETRLSLKEHSLQAWARPGDRSGYGLEVNASTQRPLALEAHIQGKKGSAHFEAWADLDCLDSSPHESLNVDTPIAGTHFVAWRRMHFEGEFDLPGTGKEQLSGSCYFQRVCLNVPVFPWKWVWSLFPDGSVFSAYVPYVGLNLFRKGYQFFDSNSKEQRTLSIMPAAFWDWNGPSERVWLKKVKVTPILGEGTHPSFAIEARNKSGDYINFLARSYGHARNWLDRPIWGERKETHWSYNEYMFRGEGVDGRIQGKAINRDSMGELFGSLEYTWGLGL